MRETVAISDKTLGNFMYLPRLDPERSWRATLALAITFYHFPRRYAPKTSFRIWHTFMMSVLVTYFVRARAFKRYKRIQKYLDRTVRTVCALVLYIAQENRAESAFSRQLFTNFGIKLRINSG